MQYIKVLGTVALGVIFLHEELTVRCFRHSRRANAPAFALRSLAGMPPAPNNPHEAPFSSLLLARFPRRQRA